MGPGHALEGKLKPSGRLLHGGVGESRRVSGCSPGQVLFHSLAEDLLDGDTVEGGFCPERPALGFCDPKTEQNAIVLGSGT